MKKIKNNKTLKYSLFFGFYLIFFITLFIFYQKSVTNKKIIDEQKELSIYEIVKESINNYQDNQYSEEIILNNAKVDYHEENEYIYFFDIYNLNKLIKNAKLSKKDDNTYFFKLGNKSLNNILETNKDDNLDNDIILYIKDNLLIKTEYNLSNYYDKDVKIEINYVKGGNDENSSS